MRRALEKLPITPDFSLIDGNRLPKDWPTPAHAVVQGDGKVLSIACASIVAKVYRDNLMAKLAEQHPYYGWEKNAGYGAPAHQQGLASYGITDHHRRSFAPIAKLVNNQ
jgi:ribonuclease HII